MLSGIERYFSVVSLLLIAGAGLIILEGPVGPGYVRLLLAAKAVEKDAHATVHPQGSANAFRQFSARLKMEATKSTWASAIDDASPLHATVLGEIPLNGKTDSATASK